MAFQMEFTDEFGENYPASYWRVVQCNICRAEERGTVIFHGYASAASVGKRVIGQKAYFVDNAFYQQYFEVEVLDPEGSNPYRSAYLMAQQVKDVDVVDGVAISFFEDAIEA